VSGVFEVAGFSGSVSIQGALGMVDTYWDEGGVSTILDVHLFRMVDTSLVNVHHSGRTSCLSP